MAELKKCRACGVDVQSNAPFGQCPKCLLELGFGAAPAEAVEASDDSAPGAEPIDAASPAPVTESPGDHIGRYKLLQKIGEGGCGVVYMAEQEEPIRRRVALKVIKLGMDTRAVIARFEAERQALAMMDHPNIAKVLDVGQTATGRPFFVMELVKGVRITEYCDQNNLPTDERLALFAQVCHAIQHAHQKGIIHRDIKPSNILVTLHDGVAVPKVIDFGIAKAINQQRLTELTLFTALGQFLGTPAYMSPEQAEMSGLDIDTRSDIYALGVLLYELLIGRTPFDGSELLKAGLDEMRRIIREQDPPKPSTRLGTMTNVDLTAAAKHRQSEPARLIHLVRGDLDWIVMKCLEKDRTRRYETASELATDLARHLRHEPVLASPPSSLYRFQKFVRRNRATVSTAITLGVVLAFGAVGSTWQWRNAVGARRGEARQRQVAETNAAESLDRLIRIDVANGVQAMEGSDWFGALLWFAEALRQDKPGTRAEEMHRLRIGALLNYSPRLIQVWFHDAGINHAVFSPDGHRALTASRDRTARLWNVLTGQPGVILAHATNVSQAVFSADGRKVLTLSDDGSVRVWDAAAGHMVCPPLEHGYRITHALISPDGRRVFTLGDPGETNFTVSFQSFGSEAGEVRIWDATTGRQARSPFRQKKRIPGLALSADGQWLAANLGISTLVWNLKQPQAIQLSSGTEGKATILPALTLQQPATEMETLLPEIPRTGKSRADENSPFVTCLAFSPDSQRIVTAYGDGSARVWRLRGAPLVLQPPKTRGPFTERSQARTASFSPDGQRVMLVSDDGIARLWDARTGESEGQIKGKADSRVRFSPDSRFIFLGGSAQVWDIETDEFITPNLPQPGWSFSQSAAFSPDGATLLTAGSDGAVRLWNLAGGLPRQPPLKHDWPIIAAQRAASQKKPRNLREQMDEALLTMGHDNSHNAFSRDGRRVVTVSRTGSARVWDAVTGEPITPYVIMDWPLDFAAFSPDGTRFVTTGGSPPEEEQGIARVWDALTGQPVTPVIKHPELLRSAAFSPDGRWLIIQGHHSAEILDVGTGQRADLPMKLSSLVSSAAFAPTRNLVAVCEGTQNDLADAGRQGRAGAPWQTRVWNTQTGQPVIGLIQETNAWSQMEFSPDGRWLMTFVGKDYFGSVRLWNVATGEPLTALLPATGQPHPVFTGDGRRCFITGLFSGPIALEIPGWRRLDPAEWRGSRMHARAVTRDGQRFAANDNGRLRVYDALTGEPLTPPLGKTFSAETVFSPEGNLLLLPGNERAELWPLPRETRPVEDIVLLAQLLAARRLDASGNLATWKSAEASVAWRVLRAKYPDSFAIAPEQEWRWREHIVEISEREGRWTTAAFHLNHLARAQPDSGPLRLRHARAVNRAAMEELR